jgi:hypothetical protein
MTINHLRSATYAGIMSRLFELNRLEMERPQLFTPLYTDFDAKALTGEGSGLSPLAHYLFMLFNLYSEIHTQYEHYQLFDQEQMRVWEARAANDFRGRRFLKGYWEAELANFPTEYTESFKAFMGKALARAEGQQERVGTHQ